MMIQSMVFSFSAVLSLALPALYFFKEPKGQGGTFWSLIAVAIAGTISWTLAQLSGEWRTSLSLAIWVTISASIISFTITCGINRLAWRLTPLLMPYLAAMGLWAMLWQAFPGHVIEGEGALNNWIMFHIAISVFTYALATIAAVAALSAFLVERALKRKRPTKLTRMLPSVIDSESLLVRLLIACEVILGLDILSGMGVSMMETGHLLIADHKSLFSIGAFVAIAGLLWAQYQSGVRGRKAARIVLVAYLLLSLGFLGVKFVTDVMMA
ncbi:cytochrome c biogenesis protein CcsA [Terasakiella sp. A23]|uniref:cytochrome C assembly family protein n=1 Tax=Terasakiella sp. FCG-A23 TaxID=3080561 RepID=UPI002954F781|nr:cytochrome c biogenesis protein CcsA [Terasakiella sp. A23]MDV7338608.1 cytochrome c biogenesis protein CcsA [Terasakiella sp. A23]